jgi:hypothetical protein
VLLGCDQKSKSLKSTLDFEYLCTLLDAEDDQNSVESKATTALLA